MTKVSHPNPAPAGKVKLGTPVGHQTSDVLGKQAAVYQTQHVDVMQAQTDNHGTQLNDAQHQPMTAPSAQGPGSIHEQVDPQEQPKISCGQANDAPSHNAALGDHEPLSPATSMPRPSDAPVPDPGAV